MFELNGESIQIAWISVLTLQLFSLSICAFQLRFSSIVLQSVSIVVCLFHFFNSVAWRHHLCLFIRNRQCIDFSIKVFVCRLFFFSEPNWRCQHTRSTVESEREREWEKKWNQCNYKRSIHSMICSLYSLYKYKLIQMRYVWTFSANQIPMWCDWHMGQFLVLWMKKIQY